MALLEATHPYALAEAVALAIMCLGNLLITKYVSVLWYIISGMAHVISGRWFLHQWVIPVADYVRQCAQFKNYPGKKIVDAVFTAFSPAISLIGPQWRSITYKKTERFTVFTRLPVPGKTKTRLIPELGAEGAASLHTRFVQHTLTTARAVRSVRPQLGIECRFTNGSKAEMSTLVGPDVTCTPQVAEKTSGGGESGKGDTPAPDLGARMLAVFQDAFAQGVERAIICGTDCPDLSPVLIEEALDLLDDADVVYGPALDGGYYLVAVRKSARAKIEPLFTGMEWSTETVLSESLSRASESGLVVKQVRCLGDCDLPRDLIRWELALSRGQVFSLQKVSVIIPTRNEEKMIASTIRTLRKQAAAEPPGTELELEIIVVDGGSSDNTCAIAESSGADVVLIAPDNFCGRARQCNFGAAHATGQLLLFLHADTQVPRNYLTHIRSTLAHPKTSLGAFALAIRDQDKYPALSLIASLANYRCHWANLPYGDQGLFLTAKVFHALGGFPNRTFMEDFDFVLAAGRIGRVVTLPDTAAAITDNRRWAELGAIRNTALNLFIVHAYRFGVPTTVLRQWYYHGRKYLLPKRNTPAIKAD